MKEHPYPPTTPLNPSEFVFLFPSCLHVAIVEVSLLFLKDIPLTCELNPPASSFVLFCFFQFSHLCCIPSFFLSPQHFQQNSHRFHRFQSLQSCSFPPVFLQLMACFPTVLHSSLSHGLVSSSSLLWSAQPSVVGLPSLQPTVFDEVSDNLQGSRLRLYSISQQRLMQ